MTKKIIIEMKNCHTHKTEKSSGNIIKIFIKINWEKSSCENGKICNLNRFKPPHSQKLFSKFYQFRSRKY